MYYFLCLLLLSFASALPPSVYWHTSPVSANATVQFAGAGFGATPAAYACLDGLSCNTRQVLPIANASWESSVFFTYPGVCAHAAPAACAFALCGTGGGGGGFSTENCTIVSDPNAPEIIFASRGSPLGCGGALFTPARTGTLS